MATQTPLKRRALMAGTAWTVPVIAVAASAPAAAASCAISADQNDAGRGSPYPDRITVTNTYSLAPIPANTKITWQLENNTGKAWTIDISQLTGVATSPAGVTSFAIGAAIGSVATLTFVTTAAIVVSGTVRWDFVPRGWSVRADWRFDSQVTVAAWSATGGACGAVSDCASVYGQTTGLTYASECPAVAAPLAAARVLSPFVMPSATSGVVDTPPLETKIPAP